MLRAMLDLDPHALDGDAAGRGADAVIMPRAGGNSDMNDVDPAEEAPEAEAAAAKSDGAAAPDDRRMSSLSARRLLLADSFTGIPFPHSARGREVDTSAHWPERYVASINQAKSTLRRYGLLDERVVFVPGLFNESLPSVRASAFALIHIDADAYDSVLDALDALYPRLSVGGHVVIDDFHLPGVRAAVHDFRKGRHVTESLLPVPSDHATSCTADWTVDDVITVQPLTVAYWTRRK